MKTCARKVEKRDHFVRKTAVITRLLQPYPRVDFISDTANAGTKGTFWRQPCNLVVLVGV